jgi:SAM-dependent methyltransferase
MESMVTVPPKLDYGQDAPGVVRNLALGAIAFLASGPIAYGWLQANHRGWAIALLIWGLLWGTVMVLQVAAMLWGSRVGKLRERDRLLGELSWRGDERVLDVGCGRGLLLIGAAKRLTTGRAIGVDIWQGKDLSGNRPEATLENARLEGVPDRVEVKEARAQSLPFEDESFDVVLSMSTIHNIPDREGRDQAIKEMVRVLRPGGRIVIHDFAHTARYASVLRQLGMAEVVRSGPSFMWCLPTRRVKAAKPSTSVQI